MFGLEDQSRAEQAVNELEQIETSAEAVADDGHFQLLQLTSRFASVHSQPVPLSPDLLTQTHQL